MFPDSPENRLSIECNVSRREEKSFLPEALEDRRTVLEASPHSSFVESLSSTDEVQPADSSGALLLAITRRKCLRRRLGRGRIRGMIHRLVASHVRQPTRGE